MANDTNHAYLEKLQALKLAEYSIPLVSDDYRITLYRFTKQDAGTIVSAYLHYIPRSQLCGPDSVKEQAASTFDIDNEYAIFINSDVCPQSEQVNTLMNCLFYWATSIAEKMESEEFGARIITAAFKEFIGHLEEEVTLSKPDPTKGMVVAQYPLPLIADNYCLTMNVFNEQTMDNVIEKLRPVYRDVLITDRFCPSNENGFSLKPSDDEFAVFINCEYADAEKQRLVLVHELFHAATELSKVFKSTVVGGNLYRAAYKEFSKVFYNSTNGNQSELQ